jgi:hypothetical protein
MQLVFITTNDALPIWQRVLRGDEDELHAADEIGAGHHHEGRVAERHRYRRSGRDIAELIAGRLGQRDCVNLAGKPRRRQHRERQHHKTGQPRPPAEILAQHLPDRRRQQRAERARRRDHAEHGRAHRRRNRTRRDRHRNCRRRAGQRSADQDACPDHDGQESMRLRHQDQARNVEQRAHDHDRAKPVAHRPGAGERLQEPPGEVLHRNRQREFGDGDADVMRQRLHEDAERLPQAHAERQHQGGADQDRKRGTKGFEQGHVSCSPSFFDRFLSPVERLQP